MASLKEIRAKVTSIKSTQKITRAMQMVAASKMKRAQDRMETGRPYAESMRRVISHLVKASSDHKHPFMSDRAVNTVGYIVVTSDRGLAGGLNINLFKTLMQDVKKQQEQSVAVEFAVIGSKGVSFFKNFGGKVTSAITDYGDSPTFEQLNAPVQAMLDDFNQGKLDRIYVVYNQFINAMTQKPIVSQLVPLSEDTFASDGIQTEHSWDYIYEPDVQTLLVAMKAATDNAGNLIDDLQLVYNKLRQAAITREISEIVGGAAAVS